VKVFGVPDIDIEAYTHCCNDGKTVIVIRDLELLAMITAILAEFTKNSDLCEDCNSCQVKKQCILLTQLIESLKTARKIQKDYSIKKNRHHFN